MKIVCVTNSDVASMVGELLRQRFEIPHLPMESFVVSNVDSDTKPDYEHILIGINDKNVSNLVFDALTDSLDFKLDIDVLNKDNMIDHIKATYEFLAKNGLDDENWKTKTGQTSVIDHILNLEAVNWKCPCGQCN
jgi:hypothetical protein